MQSSEARQAVSNAAPGTAAVLWERNNGVCRRTVTKPRSNATQRVLKAYVRLPVTYVICSLSARASTIRISDISNSTCGGTGSSQPERASARPGTQLTGPHEIWYRQFLINLIDDK
jgi:hypothetical protein